LEDLNFYYRIVLKQTGKTYCIGTWSGFLWHMICFDSWLFGVPFKGEKVLTA
jgi:hypothetical protein